MKGALKLRLFPQAITIKVSGKKKHFWLASVMNSNERERRVSISTQPAFTRSKLKMEKNRALFENCSSLAVKTPA